MKKIGFVIPWYYKDIRGGAEQELRGLVQHLHAAGVEVEVITTCVKEFASDWTENYFKEGTEQIDGITVRRFKVRKGNMKDFHSVNAKLMQGKTISYEEETTLRRWLIVRICMIISGNIVKIITGLFLFLICLEQLITEFSHAHLNQY